MFHQKWSEVKSKLRELQRKHFEEPAGAEFCYGQKLDPAKERATSFHCYDPSCPSSKRHHQRQFQPAESESRDEQLVMSEATESFGPPFLRPLHEPWQERDAPVFERLFEETATLLAMFLREEVEEGKELTRPWYLQTSGAEDQGADFWCPLQPQIKDVLKMLWQGDLSGEGIYLNIALHIRKLCSRLLMHALGRTINNPMDYDKAKKKKSPFQKAMCLQKDLDNKAKPFTDVCIQIDLLGSALVHHKDAADFHLASNTGNTTIMLCRLIVMACAKYADWVGWSKGSDHPDFGRLKETFRSYRKELKDEIGKGVKHIELCFLCMDRPATHAYVHNKRGCAHMITCRQCSRRENMHRCPVCRDTPDGLVEVLRHTVEPEDHDEHDSGAPQPSGPSVTLPPPAEGTTSKGQSSNEAKWAAGKIDVHPDPERQHGSEEELKGQMQGLRIGDDGQKARAMHEPKKHKKTLDQQGDMPMSLEEQAEHVELEAMRMCDRGQQHKAEELLKRAASCAGLPEGLKAHLQLKQLELSLQLGAQYLSPARKFDCEVTLRHLWESLVATPQSQATSTSDSTATSGSEGAALLRRLHVCRGRLQVLLGKHGEAAQCFGEAVEAAGLGGGDVLRCLGEASSAHLAHATQLQQIGLLDPALQAARHSIECAHLASNTATTFHASSLAAHIYDGKAAKTGNTAWRVHALQLSGFALEQCAHKLPVGVSVAEAEGLAHKCEELLGQVVQAHSGAAHTQLPQEFVSKIQQALRGVSLAVASSKSDQHLLALDTSFTQLQHSAVDLQRRLSMLAQQEEQQLAQQHAGQPASASSSSTAAGASASGQQQHQQWPAQPCSLVANHLNSNREELIRYWREFDLEAFQRKGLPVLDDETEADRKLRAAFTHDVYRYFKEMGKLALEAKGETGTAPTFGPKMHAFVQTVAFRLYRASRNKKRRAAQEEQERKDMMARDPVQGHLSQVASGLQQLQSSSVGMLHSFNALAAKASPVPPQKPSPTFQKPGPVALYLDSNREELMRYWREFDLEAFQRMGLPIPPDETEAERKLRAAFTHDVYRYFKENGKLALEAKGETGTAPTFGPKMHAFAQTVAFRLYRASRNKKRKAAQVPEEAAAGQPQV